MVALVSGCSVFLDDAGDFVGQPFDAGDASTATPDSDSVATPDASQGLANPTSSFTYAVNGLDVTFDGAASMSKNKGPVTSFAWDFGDGSAAAGAKVVHTYAADGAFVVRLTVIDSDGDAGTSTQLVKTTPSAATPFAADAFERTLTKTLGIADIGGAWDIVNIYSTGYSVSAGKARLSVGAGLTLTSKLNIATTDDELRVDVALDRLSEGSGTHLSFWSRAVGANTYLLKCIVSSSGATTSQFTRSDGSSEVALSPFITLGTYNPGDLYRVRMQTFGTNPTKLRSKVWPVGTTEPAGWQQEISDASSALQAKGSNAGMGLYASSSATKPVVASFDNFWLGPN